MDIFSTAYTFIDRGGVIGWIIVSAYIAVLAVISERAAYFIRSGYRRSILISNLEKRASDAGNESSGRSFEWPKFYRRSQPARIAESFMENINRPAKVLDEVLDREGAVLHAEMERGLEILSVIGQLAPLCGLLGTVTGLMSSFKKIQDLGGAVDVGAFSGGIWEAMITTAFGLVAAIPAVAACRLFQRITELRCQDMSYTVSLLSERLREDRIPVSEDSEGEWETA